MARAARALLAMKLTAWLLTLRLALALASLNRIVKVRQGLLRGRLTDAGDTSYLAVRGIPYAQPPVGPLRFKATVPVAPWKGTRDARTLGSDCPQLADGAVTGAEDCLYLNVYTTRLLCKRLKPVLVWIHGGMFLTGSGARVDASRFVFSGVVVVTFNYRLGALGYLSLLHPEIPGNAGSKDQAMVLKWVQQNIVKFGGDPSSVTIFGEGSGGASVHSHMLSPMSLGLFGRAISQSGTMMCFWATTLNPKTKARLLADAVNCTQTADDELAACLRALPAETIVRATTSVVLNEDVLGEDAVPFALVVDRYVPGAQMFLPELPRTLLEEGRFQRVPFLAGTTNAEALRFLSSAPNLKQTLKTLNKEVQYLAPFDPHVFIDNDERQIAGRKIKEFYFGEKSISEETLPQLQHLITDSAFIWPTLRTLELHLAYTKRPQYLYYFTYEGELNMEKKQLGPKFKNEPGATHGDDTHYLFNFDHEHDILGESSPEMLTSLRMVRMWTNFVKTSRPTRMFDSKLNVTWARYLRGTKRYLQIGVDLTAEHALRQQEMKFWNSQYCLNCN